MDDGDRTLRAALARSVDAVVVVDASGVVTVASPSVGAFFGHTPDEAVGMNALDLVHPDDLALTVESLTSTSVEPGRKEPLEIRVAHADGTWRAVGLVAVNCLDDPEVRGIVLTVRDHTGLAEHERTLAERDDRYRQIVEMAAEGVWVIDAEGSTTFVTGRMAAMLGYSADEMVGRGLAEFTHPDLEEVLEGNLERRRHGISESHPFRFLHRDGHVVHVQVVATPVMGHGGTYLGSIAMVSDVTQQHEERVRLAEAEARHRALIGALPDLLLRLSADGTYLDYHAGRESELAVPPHVFLGRRARDVLPQQVATETEQAIASSLRTGEVVEFEYDLPVDGKLLTFEARVAGMPQEEALVLVRNVTELRAAEAARRDLLVEAGRRRAAEQVREGLEQGERLESLGRLAGGVAHDINNLLGVIANYAVAVRSSTAEPDTADDVREIEAAVRRGVALTRRLLMIGRRDATAMVDDDIGEVVRELEGTLRGAVEPDHPIRFELPSSCPVVSIDRAQVGQALMNLVVNAADASAPGHEIVVGLRVGGDGDDGDDGDDGEGGDGGGDGAVWVELSVRDHGRGMTSSVRAHAFEPFFTTKEDGYASGLGLSIVHGVAVEHGGTVDIACPSSGGTIVTLRFPVTVADRAVDRSDRSDRSDGSDPPQSLRILVVDDDADSLRSAARLLEAAGHQVMVASSSSEALARVRPPDRPDVVLVDVVMPGVSGPALAAMLREQHPDMPVVLMTGYGGDLLADTAPGLIVLAKPLELPVVERALRDAVGQTV